MFANAALARRIEGAETALVLEAARAAARRLPADGLYVVEFHGGAVAFVEEGSPFNKVVGLGFDGVPAPGAIAEVEREFMRRGASIRFEISNLANPQLALALTRSGYALVGFENVLGLPITPALVDRLSATRSDVVVRRASDGETQAWLDTVATAFLHPDVNDGPPSTESFSKEALERVFGDTIAASSFERYLAWCNNAIAGGANFRIEQQIAQLSGAATLPAHRRRGVQTALLRQRLLDAAARGCDLAVVTTEPGSKSQENVQKAGFVLLYTRAVLVKEAAPH